MTLFRRRFALVTLGFVFTFALACGRETRHSVRVIENWVALDSGGLHMGPAHPQVTLVEFGDFQCPPCQRASTLLEGAVHGQGQDIAVEFRNLPLTKVHPFALDAARAAICAARQVGFARVYATFYKEQEQFGRRPWTAIVADAGVQDTAAVKTCMAEPAVTSLIARDVALAKELGVNSTPTLIVNGIVLIGVPTEATLEKAIALARDQR